MGLVGGITGQPVKRERGSDGSAVIVGYENLDSSLSTVLARSATPGERSDTDPVPPFLECCSVSLQSSSEEGDPHCTPSIKRLRQHSQVCCTRPKKCLASAHLHASIAATPYHPLPMLSSDMSMKFPHSVNGMSEKRKLL